MVPFPPMPDAQRTPILWHSNAPWVGTGYGSQSALFAPRVAALGYDLAFSAFFGLKGAKLAWGDIPVYPGARDVYGNDILYAHWNDHSKGRPGLVLTLTDPWVLSTKVCARLPVAAWIPVDHEPLMPRTGAWLAKTDAVPIAMSRFGQEMMADFEPLYVPHGFDPEVFQPMPDRTQARRLLGLPQDAFIVGMVAANKGEPSRKGFSQALQGFAQFQERHTDSVLYMHTAMEDPEGENLLAMCDALNVRPKATNQYTYASGMPAAHVAVMMNAFDVLLNPSHGEGFGVPLIESQACGTPVIATNWSAMKEVADPEHGNWLVDGERTWTPFESWQKVAYVDGIADALGWLYAESEDERLHRRDRVREHAQGYTAEYVTETYFRPAIQEALDRITWRGARAVAG